MSDFMQSGEGLGTSAPAVPTTTSQGEPASIYAPIVPPQEQAQPQAGQSGERVNLDQFPEFRQWKSNADRRQHEMQMQLQAAQAQLAQFQQQAKQQQFDQRLAQARTVEEQAAIHQERLQEQAYELEARTVEQQDVANLHDWDVVYEQEWGIPSQALQMINKVAEVDATDPQGNFDLGAFHHRRDALAKMARSHYMSYQQQAQPQQPAPQQPRYAPQAAYRPQMGASPTLSFNEALNQAMRSRDDTDWARVNKIFRLR